jgi:pantetheine-phosphate adenylyltransferase
VLRQTKTAIYPGTFDPITYGHIDLIERGLKVFNKIIVAVAMDSPKSSLFSLEERIQMTKRVVGNKRNVSVEAFHGLVVNFAKRKKARVLLRGVRMLSDFEYEFQMALTNRKLAQDVETVFLMPNESYSYLTSSLIKETAMLGANVRTYVPAYVHQCLKAKLRNI